MNNIQSMVCGSEGVGLQCMNSGDTIQPITECVCVCVCNK
jgi:hypothetical protein